MLSPIKKQTPNDVVVCSRDLEKPSLWMIVEQTWIFLSV